MSVRLRTEVLDMLNDLSALESVALGRKIFASDLIRMAIDFTYSDNERMREVFRRTRGPITRRRK